MIARLNVGGPAQQAALLSGRRFDPERYEVLLVHGRLGPGEDSMAELVEREGGRAIYMPALAQAVSPGHDASAFGRLAQLIRRYRPDVVHTHTAKAGFVGRTAALTVRPRPVIVHTFHGHVLAGYFGRAKSEVFRRIERRLALFSDRLLGVSQATVDDLVELDVAARERFQVVPLGLDLERFAAVEPTAGADLREQLGIADGEVLLTFTGRLVAIKNVSLLLEAMAIARVSEHGLRLAIVGDGEERRALERLTDRLGLRSRVEFLGYRRDLPRIVAASDLAVLSSDNEGTPVALIEAAAGGVPAVATAVGGVADVVRPESGMLVPAGDATALAGALQRLGSDSQLRGAMGARAREHALANYGAERLITDIDRLYRELLASRSSPPGLN